MFKLLSALCAHGANHSATNPEPESAWSKAICNTAGMAVQRMGDPMPGAAS